MVRSIVQNEEERVKMTASLAELIPEARIQAEAEVIARPPGHSIPDVLRAYSKNAGVVFLGLTDPAPGTEQDYADHLANLVEGLRTTIFVRNAGRFAGRLI